jgi:hypothetical protein
VNLVHEAAAIYRDERVDSRHYANVNKQGFAVNGIRKLEAVWAGCCDCRVKDVVAVEGGYRVEFRA